jgi:hypothetical protein
MALILIATVMQGQSVYVRAGLGGAISTSPKIDYESGSSGTIESKRVGYGNGLPFVVAGGYYFGEHFGLELGVNYLFGFPNKIKSSDNYYTNTEKFSGSMLSVVPAFVMKFDVGRVKPYCRIGLLIGVLNSSNANAINNYISTEETTEKIYGGIAIGVQGAIGAELALNKLLSLFGEVNIDGISWAPTKGKYTKYTYNGVDQLSNMTTKQKSWVYVKSFDETQYIPSSDPDKESLVNYSFANAGLIVGVKVHFGK